MKIKIKLVKKSNTEKSIASVFILIYVLFIISNGCSQRYLRVNKPKGVLSSFQPPASATLEMNFNPGWLLAKGSFPLFNVDDSSWEKISTPHTYHEKNSFHGLKKGIKDLGPYTYRKHFNVPSDYSGRKIFLEFQGIRQRGQFYLNGQLLGRISDGVTPFGFDITPYVKFGMENILHVEIDCNNKEFETDQSMCWFFPGFNPLYGGICRNVILHVVPKVHATLPIYSILKSEGTYVYAENISTENRSADIGIEVQVRNDDNVARTIGCRALLVARTGKKVVVFESNPLAISKGENFTFKMKENVTGLHFWQPGHPYLYDVYTIVTVGSEKPDVRKLTTGFRKIEVRGAEFFINNRVLMTQGYTPRSQNEWPAIGNAYPDWLHDYSNAMMVEGNSRLVRWMHTMPSPQDVNSCDRIGLMQIMPGADLENDSKGREWEMRLDIMRNTIIYCRNNPSIILWEAANNVITKEHIQQMIDLRNQWDPHGYKRPMGGRAEGPEWVSWMYGVRKEKQRLSVDTEFLRDESPRRWWDAWSPPYFNEKGNWKLVDNAGGWNRNQDNMCLIQSIVYEQYYNARPGTGEAVCNGGVQIFFADGDSFTRSVDPFRRSGSVDGMRIPKDAYFCNQTMWSNTPELWTEGKPSVFLPGHWNYPSGTVKPIFVFVSPGVEKVKLSINGKPVAGGQRTNKFLFTFPNVKWEPGNIEAIGFDVAGNQIARMSHETSGNPADLRMKVIQSPEGLRADGSDLVIIETEVVDKKGRRAPLAQNLIKYQVEGNAVWRGGIWEEEVLKYSNSKELPVLNGIHRVVIRSTEQQGLIKVTATSAGLKATTVLIKAQEAGISNGTSRLLPATLPVILKSRASYGPDLAPVPPITIGIFDNDDLGTSATGEMIFGLSTAFPQGATLIQGVKNGAVIYKDRPWTFIGLPEYLVGAWYLQVANDDAIASAAEGIMFKIGKAGRVYIAYDDGNVQFPLRSSPTGFNKTDDKIIINGHQHSIYQSGAMNGGELTYLGTNSWIEQPPAGLNNYIVFVKPEISKP